MVLTDPSTHSDRFRPPRLLERPSPASARRAGAGTPICTAWWLVAVSLLASAGACSRVEPPQLIVLITIDTLRADHLPVYGYPRDTSPFLAQLAAQGVVFDAAYSNIATTAPAHTSIFTSLYPTQHGVTRNGIVLDEGVETLAERLRSAGYTTVAVASTNRHFLRAGIMQGFAHTDEPDVDDVRWYRPAEESVDVAIAKLGELTDVPVFLWLHVFDPHTPYAPPAATVEKIANRDDGDELLHYLEKQQRLDLDFYLDRETALAVMNDYDAEIAYADAALRRFWQATSSHSEPGASVWIVTSDHGEGLGNHFYRGHGRNIYKEQLHVPLVFWGPGRVPEGERRKMLVTHLDIAPTLLELANADAAGSLRLAEGRSLIPLLESPSKGLQPVAAVAERRSYDGEDSQKWALQDDSYSFIYGTDLEDELFDSRTDPYQTRNLVQIEPDVARRYRARLDFIVARLAAIVPDSGLVDEETLKRLRSMGYIQ